MLYWRYINSSMKRNNKTKDTIAANYERTLQDKYSTMYDRYSE
jgi:hypothetical protein